MNPGILTPPTQFATMPRGLLGRPTAVPMIDARRVFDPDAARYIAAVERADGRPLEEAVRVAIGEFVIGCKADGIWSAIKASCLLMGARTLSGALTPLVGPAPTNNGPFVSGDYSRSTGLVGNGTTKFLDSGRNNNADPQNSQHLAVYVTTAATSSSAQFPIYIGVAGGDPGASHFGRLSSNGNLFVRSRNGQADTASSGSGSATGLIGINRAASNAYTARISGSDSTFNRAAETPPSRNVFVFASSGASGATASTQSNARIAFYSFGESLTLSSLDSRLATLYNAIGAAIA